MGHPIEAIEKKRRSVMAGHFIKRRFEYGQILSLLEETVCCGRWISEMVSNVVEADPRASDPSASHEIHGQVANDTPKEKAGVADRLTACPVPHQKTDESVLNHISRGFPILQSTIGILVKLAGVCAKELFDIDVSAGFLRRPRHYLAATHHNFVQSSSRTQALLIIGSKDLNP